MAMPAQPREAAWHSKDGVVASCTDEDGTRQTYSLDVHLAPKDLPGRPADRPDQNGHNSSYGHSADPTPGNNEQKCPVEAPNWLLCTVHQPEYQQMDPGSMQSHSQQVQARRKVHNGGTPSRRRDRSGIYTTESRVDSGFSNSEPHVAAPRCTCMVGERASGANGSNNTGGHASLLHHAYSLSQVYSSLITPCEVHFPDAGVFPNNSARLPNHGSSFLSHPVLPCPPALLLPPVLTNPGTFRRRQSFLIANQVVQDMQFPARARSICRSHSRNSRARSPGTRTARSAPPNSARTSPRCRFPRGTSSHKHHHVLHHASCSPPRTGRSPSFLRGCDSPDLPIRQGNMGTPFDEHLTHGSFRSSRPPPTHSRADSQVPSSCTAECSAPARAQEGLGTHSNHPAPQIHSAHGIRSHLQHPLDTYQVAQYSGVFAPSWVMDGGPFCHSANAAALNSRRCMSGATRGHEKVHAALSESDPRRINSCCSTRSHSASNTFRSDHCIVPHARLGSSLRHEDSLPCPAKNFCDRTEGDRQPTQHVCRVCGGVRPVARSGSSASVTCDSSDMNTLNLEERVASGSTFNSMHLGLDTEHSNESSKRSLGPSNPSHTYTSSLGSNSRSSADSKRNSTESDRASSGSKRNSDESKRGTDSKLSTDSKSGDSRVESGTSSPRSGQGHSRGRAPHHEQLPGRPDSHHSAIAKECVCSFHQSAGLQDEFAAASERAVYYRRHLESYLQENAFIGACLEPTQEQLTDPAYAHIVRPFYVPIDCVPYPAVAQTQNRSGGVLDETSRVGSGDSRSRFKQFFHLKAMKNRFFTSIVFRKLVCASSTACPAPRALCSKEDTSSDLCAGARRNGAVRCARCPQHRATASSEGPGRRFTADKRWQQCAEHYQAITTSALYPPAPGAASPRTVGLSELSSVLEPIQETIGGSLDSTRRASDSLTHD